MVVRSQVQLALNGELLPIEQFGIGGSDTVGGYRQDAVLADSGIFGSAELWYPICHRRQTRSFAGDANFVDFGQCLDK